MSDELMAMFDENHGDDAGMSALEFLSQVTLVLIPILAMAVVLLNQIQSQVLDRFQSDMQRHGFTQVQQLVDESQKQRLIARIERVLRQYRDKMCLEAFPIEGAGESRPDLLFAPDEQGFARDPRFRRLCDEACKLFREQTPAEFQERIDETYRTVLEPLPDGSEMFDRTYRKPPTNDDKADIVSQENRDFALKQIKTGLENLERHAMATQRAAADLVAAALVSRVEATAALGADAIPDELSVRAKVDELFRKKELPLLTKALVDQSPVPTTPSQPNG